MSNFRKDIEEVLADEIVEAIVVNKQRECMHKYGTRYNLPDALANTPLSWEEVRAHLDYEYDDGYGGEDCHAVYVYTATRVLFICSYDGSTWVSAVPRNPEACTPGMFGGG